MLGLSPTGNLKWFASSQEEGDGLVAQRARATFEGDDGLGVLLWGAREVGTALPPALGYWREVGRLFATRLRQVAGDGGPDAAMSLPAPEVELARLAGEAPPMHGVEYLTCEVLRRLWERMNAALAAALAESGSAPGPWLAAQNSAWHQVGRIHLHLAFNKADDQRPFALLATYASRLSALATAQHQPLGRAVKDLSERGDRDAVLRLLEPLRRATERSEWVRAALDSRALFAPMRLTAAEAHAFLEQIPRLEEAGLSVRLPEGWLGRRPPRAQVRVTVGAVAPAATLGIEELLSFSVDVAIDGEPLTNAERAVLLSSTDGLVLLRGRWVEVDGAKLASTLERYRAVQARALREGIPFAEANLQSSLAVVGRRVLRGVR